MPRANRHILPGYIYHLTHRCHNRNFLLGAGFDRIEYWRRLYQNVHKHHISLFTFCVTCNHVHLVGMCKKVQDISRFMQQQEGEFAEYYNWRKNRRGAFWEGRFHCTMIEGGEHLWNCLRYIDLNMVRAGMVSHPGEWPWCGYHELVGERKRYLLLDIDRLVDLLGANDRRTLAELYRERILDAVRGRHMDREAIWTESIAVGSEDFLREIASKNRTRKKLTIAMTKDGTSYLKEIQSPYGANPVRFKKRA